jgi:hypothetical protein
MHIKMKWKLLAVAACLVAMPLSAQARVEESTETGDDYEITYPIVYTDDKAAEENINGDIYFTYLKKFKEAVPASDKSVFKYEVKSEDDDVLSLMITIGNYMDGAAHGNYTVYGAVYDKHTGERLPLEHYLQITVEDLQDYYADHTYTHDGRQVTSFLAAPERVSTEYYRLSDGSIGLIYEPYELASYANGAPVIQFSAQDVAQFDQQD